jgi:hypothetical protein
MLSTSDRIPFPVVTVVAFSTLEKSLEHSSSYSLMASPHRTSGDDVIEPTASASGIGKRCCSPSGSTFATVVPKPGVSGIIEVRDPQVI